MQSAVHSPYASSVPPGYAHHMPPPSNVTMQQQVQQQTKGNSTPNRADYGSYSPYSSQHGLSGPPPPSSSVPHSPLPPGAPVPVSVPPAAQQRMRPPAPAYDPRMTAAPQHQPHPQHQQQQPVQPQQYAPATPHHPGADGVAGHPAPLPGGSAGMSSGVSASMALMANIYDDLVHELVLDTCYGVHKQEKTASFAPRTGYDGGDLDACGQPVKLGKNADVLFKCEICSRSVGSGKFASHLEKCMGKGRNAARSARRKMIDYSENGLSEQAAVGRQFSGGSNNNTNGHSIGRTATPPVSMPPPVAPGGSGGGGGQRYSQPPGGSGSSGYYQQQQPPNPPPPVNVMSPPMQYRHGETDSWIQQQQQQQHGQLKGAQPYPHNPSYPPPAVSTTSSHYPPLPHPPIDYSSLPALPSPILPSSSSSSAKRRLSPPPMDVSPTAKRAASRGRPSSAASASSSEWWSEPLPPLLPHHVSTGGYPHLLYVSSPGFPLHAAAPSAAQVAALLSTICGCVVGGVDEGKMCCNRREGCGSHRDEERADVRRRLERGDMEVRVKRIKPKPSKDTGKSK